MEQGHGDHLVALSPHLAEGCDDLRPCEQGHKGEVPLLLPERVLGDAHQPWWRGERWKGQCQMGLGHTRGQDRSRGTELLPPP